MDSCGLVFLLWVCRLEDGAAAVGGNGGVLPVRAMVKGIRSKGEVVDGAGSGAGCRAVAVLQVHELLHRAVCGIVRFDGNKDQLEHIQHHCAHRYQLLHVQTDCIRGRGV